MCAVVPNLQWSRTCVGCGYLQALGRDRCGLVGTNLHSLGPWGVPVGT